MCRVLCISCRLHLYILWRHNANRQSDINWKMEIVLNSETVSGSGFTCGAFSLLTILEREGLLGDPSSEGLAFGPLEGDGQARPVLPHHLLLPLAGLAGEGPGDPVHKVWWEVFQKCVTSFFLYFSGKVSKSRLNLKRDL